MSEYTILSVEVQTDVVKKIQPTRTTAYGTSQEFNDDCSYS